MRVVPAPRTAPSSAPSPDAAGVVVGVDGSHTAVRAVAWAAAEAERLGVGVHMVQVLPLADPGAAVDHHPHGRARALLYRAWRTAAAVAPLVPRTAVTVRGRVGPTLVSVATDACLLVVGSGGIGSPAEPTIGPVLLSVTARAACPVVVVPGEWAGPVRRSQRPVVVGVAGSARDERILEFAVDAAERRGVGVVAVHAWTATLTHARGRVVRGFGDAQRRAQAEERERRVLADSLAGVRARHPEVPIESLLVRGRPDAAVVHEARRAQLVVVGERGRGGVGVLFASTSHVVMRYSSCPTAVLPPGLLADEQAAPVATDVPGADGSARVSG